MIMGNLNKKIFKLVLGLGNNSLEQISKLCGIYALAGADVFDLSPSVCSLNAARKGILDVGLNPDDFKFCISLGLKGDKHIRKASINQNKCNQCLKCINICPQKSIFIKNNLVQVDFDKCIGCGLCKDSCIDFVELQTDINKVAEEFIDKKIDMVELHISSKNKSEITKNWEIVLKKFQCQKSICIDRSKYGDKELIDLMTQLVSMDSGYTIIQADGIPMSGTSAKSSTLQAVAHAQLYKDIDAGIFLSGGTNSYTKELAKECKIRFDGITMGSFARNILKDTISTDINKAIEVAKKLVKEVQG